MLEDFWVNLWLLKSTLVRKRKPKASKWEVKQFRPHIDQLEKRQLFSYQPTLFQPPFAMGGASAFDQVPWYGQLGDTIQSPLNALSGVPNVQTPDLLSQLTYSGSFEFDIYSYATV